MLLPVLKLDLRNKRTYLGAGHHSAAQCIGLVVLAVLKVGVWTIPA